MTAESCSGRIDSIHRFLDNDLSRSEQEALLLHLAGCQACQSLLAELQALFSELAALPEVEAPADLAGKVMTQLPNRPSRPRYVSLAGLILVGQTAIGLVLLVLSWPVLTLAVNGTIGAQFWPVLIDSTGSIQAGFVNVVADLIAELQSIWLIRPDLLGLKLTPAFALALVAGLILAWLIGNGLLLRDKSTSLRKEGIS
jgi:anti-sigma factor RsiW